MDGLCLPLNKHYLESVHPLNQIGRGLYALARQIKETLIETLRMANFCIYDRLL